MSMPGNAGAGIARRRFLALAAGASALGVAAPAIAQRARVMRFGSMMPPDTIYHRACLMFADEFARLSSQRMKVEVYPSSQLGSIAEMLSATQVGSLPITMAVPAWYSKFMKPIDAFTLPYIVSAPEKLRPAIDGELGKAIDRLGDAAGFKVIGYWLIGGRHIVNRVRAVNTPADCAGLKIRDINSQVYIQAFRALGASTVAMDPSELYLALQQGVIDGFEYPIPDLLATSSTRSRNISRSTTTRPTSSSSRSTRASGTASRRRIATWSHRRCAPQWTGNGRNSRTRSQPRSRSSRR